MARTDPLFCYQKAKQAPQPPIVTPSFQDYGGLGLGRSLGPAGEQFLEQTPWANPNHPSNAHLLQQRQASVSHQQQVAQTTATSHSYPQQQTTHGHVKTQRPAKDAAADGDNVRPTKHVNGPGSSSSHAKQQQQQQQHEQPGTGAPPTKKAPRAVAAPESSFQQPPPAAGQAQSQSVPQPPKTKSHVAMKAPPQDQPVKTEPLPTGVAV